MSVTVRGSSLTTVNITASAGPYANTVAISIPLPAGAAVGDLVCIATNVSWLFGGYGFTAIDSRMHQIGGPWWWYIADGDSLADLAFTVGTTDLLAHTVDVLMVDYVLPAGVGPVAYQTTQHATKWSFKTGNMGPTGTSADLSVSVDLSSLSAYWGQVPFVQHVQLATSYAYAYGADASATASVSLTGSYGTGTSDASGVDEAQSIPSGGPYGNQVTAKAAACMMFLDPMDQAPGYTGRTFTSHHESTAVGLYPSQTHGLTVRWVALIPPSFFSGTDLLQDGAGHLYRCYRASANVKVGCSLDGGATWTDVTAATDAGSDAAPTLCMDRYRNLQVWYHTAAGAAKARLSTDLGLTWADFATHAGVKYPRARLQRGGMLLVGYVGSGLTVHTSADYGANLTSAYTIGSVDAQLAALEVDRRDLAHLVYRDGAGALQHRYGADGASWSTADEWAASGQYPGLAIGGHEGLLTYYAGGSLVAKSLSAGADAVVATLATPGGSYAPGYHGLLIDRWRNLWSVGQQSDGTMLPRYSKDAGAVWLT